MARWGAVLGVVLVVALAAGEAQAQKSGDRATEMKAREAFAAGRYEDALGLFAKLYAETLHPVYLRNIGRCHQKMRQPDKAIDKFREYLAKERKIGAEERAEIDGYIKEMETLRDEQAKAAAPPPPPVTPIPPPPPINTAPYPPPPPTGTASATLVSQPQPVEAESPIYKKWWFWTGVGVLVAGGVITAVVLSSGGTTRPNCPMDVLVCQ
jgi:hypothetical protein